MEKITSFTIDHIKLQPGMYVSRKDKVGTETVTTFDLRLTKQGGLLRLFLLRPLPRYQRRSENGQGKRRQRQQHDDCFLFHNTVLLFSAINFMLGEIISELRPNNKENRPKPKGLRR